MQLGSIFDAPFLFFDSFRDMCVSCDARGPARVKSTVNKRAVFGDSKAPKTSSSLSTHGNPPPEPPPVPSFTWTGSLELVHLDWSKLEILSGGAVEHMCTCEVIVSSVRG